MSLIGLPVGFDMRDEPNACSGLVIHASAAGLRFQTFNDTPLSKKINMKVSFPSVLSQKKLYTFCHSGLDPESSVFDLDSRFRGNDDSHHHCKDVLETLH